MKKMCKIKKILSFLFVGLGIMTLASCESTAHDSYVDLKETQVKIYEDSQTHKKYAKTTIGIVNNTIYNVVGMELQYDLYDDEGTKLNQETIVYQENELFVRHGAAGYLLFSSEITEPAYADVASVKVTKATPNKYTTLWQTYQTTFIVAFVIMGISSLFFAFELFRKGLTKEGAKELLRSQVTSMSITLLLCVIICLIPLLFSSWVTTLILFGGFAGSFVIDVLLTLIKMLINKKNA